MLVSKVHVKFQYMHIFNGARYDLIQHLLKGTKTFSRENNNILLILLPRFRCNCTTNQGINKSLYIESLI